MAFRFPHIILSLGFLVAATTFTLKGSSQEEIDNTFNTRLEQLLDCTVRFVRDYLSKDAEEFPGRKSAAFTQANIFAGRGAQKIDQSLEELLSHNVIAPALQPLATLIIAGTNGTPEAAVQDSLARTIETYRTVSKFQKEHPQHFIYLYILLDSLAYDIAHFINESDDWGLFDPRKPLPQNDATFFEQIKTKYTHPQERRVLQHFFNLIAPFFALLPPPHNP